MKIIVFVLTPLIKGCADSEAFKDLPSLDDVLSAAGFPLYFSGSFFPPTTGYSTEQCDVPLSFSIDGPAIKFDCTKIRIANIKENGINMVFLTMMMSCLETLEIVGVKRAFVLELVGGFGPLKDTLKHLRIKDCKLTKTDLLKILELKSLEILDLSSVDLSDANSEQMRINDLENTLRILKLDHCILPPSFVQKFTVCTSLEALNLESSNHPCYLNRDFDFGNLKSTLSILNLTKCYVESSVIERLIDFEKLQMLNLECTDLTSLGSDFDFGSLKCTIKGLDLANCICNVAILDKLVDFEGLESLNVSKLLCRTEPNESSVLKSLPSGWKKFLKMTRLDISNNSIDLDGVRRLANMLPNLKYLNISNNRLYNTATEHLASIKALQHLNVSNNRIGDEGVARISGVLANLIHLDVSNNMIGDAGVETISNLANLTYLDISGNKVGVKGTVKITQLKDLVYLNMERCVLNEIGVQNIANMRSLKSLIVTDCDISYQCVEMLTCGLTDLEYLNISRNTIMDEAAVKIARNFKRLKHLEMDVCSVGDAGVIEISRNLSKLNCLSLSYNSIGDDGAVHLSKMASLTELDLSWNNIGSNGVAYISKMDNLRSLGMAYNAFRSVDAIHLSKMNKLKCIHLSDDQVRNESWDPITILLASTLDELYIG